MLTCAVAEQLSLQLWAGLSQYQLLPFTYCMICFAPRSSHFVKLWRPVCSLMLNDSVRHNRSGHILNSSSASFSKRWILHDNNLCLGHCLQTQRETLAQKNSQCFIYTKVSGWCVITSLLHVCCILLHHSLVFAHLKFVRLTFWQDKPFVCALLHREKKNNLNTVLCKNASQCYKVNCLFFCYIFVRFCHVGPVLSDFGLCVVIFQ